MKPTIHLQDERWKKALRPYCKTVEGICDAVILSEARSAKSKDRTSRKRDPSAALRMTVSVVLADDAFVRELNQQFRGKDKPTNVLSFPNEDEPLGDVVLAYDTIACEAEDQGKTFRDHAAHLIIHGILHLMGFDHETAADAQKMEALEIKILGQIGISNPYL